MMDERGLILNEVCDRMGVFMATIRFTWPTRSLQLWALLFFTLIFGLSCRARQEYYPGGFVQTGIASWYGPEFHGQPTSSREIYNMHDLTAAHNSLPLGALVMVTNLSNGKSVVVRINDRGPFVKGRVIDLSYAAAKALDMIGPGTVEVRIELLPSPSLPRLPPSFSVQVGSFIIRENADQLRRELENSYKNVFITELRTPRQVYYRVRLKAENLEAARELALKLAASGYTAIVYEEE